jgi:uncharacterized protein YpuA (DUF1002 family)
MQTQHLISNRPFFFISIVLFASLFLLISCKSGQAVQKPMSFSDVEKEFKFAKPLSEQSKQVILKQFGTVQNYHDSIIARRNNPHYKHIIVTGKATEADSAVMKIFSMSKEELQRAGIKLIDKTNSKK